MPPPGVQLYFIAIIPPLPIYDEAQSMKEYFRDKYQSKASLNSPPHITLHMPFQWKEKKEEKLIDELTRFSLTCKSFILSLNNYSCFEPRVIFIDVKYSEELAEMQKQLHAFCKRNLNVFNDRHLGQPYHPHLTLAFRDLKKDKFDIAWEELKSKTYARDFSVNEIFLLKHPGKRWEVLKKFTFNC